MLRFPSKVLHDILLTQSSFCRASADRRSGNRRCLPVLRNWAGLGVLPAIVLALLGSPTVFAGGSLPPPKDSGTCVSCSGKTSVLLNRGVVPGTGGRQDPSSLADMETIAFEAPRTRDTAIDHTQVNGIKTQVVANRKLIKLHWGDGPSSFGKTDSVAFERWFWEDPDVQNRYTAIDPEIGAVLIYTAQTGSEPVKYELWGVDGSRLVKEGMDSSRTIKIFNPSGRLIHHETFSGGRKLITGSRTTTRVAAFHQPATGGPTTFNRIELTEKTEAEGNAPEIIHRRTVIHDGRVSGILHRRRVTTIDSDGAIFSTIYVYHPSDSVDNHLHGRLWFEVGPAGVARMLAATEKLNAGVVETSPQQQCGLDRWEDEGGKPFITDEELKAYASYINADYDEQGRVTERISFGPGGCGSCPGSDPTPATYVYGNSPRFTMITEPSGLRRVTIYNNRNQVEYTIRTYVVDDVQSDKFWIEHNIYDTSNRLTERRGVLACSNYSVDPATWVVTTAASSEGIVDIYEYDGEGYLIAHKRKNEANGDLDWVSKTEYGAGGHSTVNGVTVKRPTKVIHYPILTDKSDHDSKRVTEYAYEFYDDSHAIKTLTVTRPAVPTAMNGDGSTAAITRTFYQKRVDGTQVLDHYPQWVLHPDNTYSLTVRDDERRTIARIEDVKTDAVGDFGDLVADLPTGWPANQDGLHGVTTYNYDDFDRLETTTSPDGITTRTEYGHINQSVSLDTLDRTTTMRVYSYQRILDGQGQPRADVAVSLTLSEPNGRSREQLVLSDSDLSAFLGFGDLGFSAEDFALFRSGGIPALQRSDSIYNQRGQLIRTEQWSNASNGSDHKLTTKYGYDEFGRRQWVQGPDGTVQWTEFDALGRAYAQFMGTHGDAESDPEAPGVGNSNLKLVSLTLIDGAPMPSWNQGVPTPPTPEVGEGHRTQQRAYFGSDEGDYLLTESHYDPWTRDSLSLSPDLILSRQRIATGESAVADDTVISVSEVYLADPNPVNYFVPDENRLLAKSKSWQDNRGRTFKTVTHEVHGAIGSRTLGNRMTTENWFDDRGRLIKSLQPSGIFTKTGYNSIGQTKWTAMGYGTATGYAAARDIQSDDTIIEEVRYAYDDDNQRPTMTTSYQRVEGSSKSGSLANAWNEQHSRRSFSAVYYDDLGRVTDQVTWGTNGDGSVPGYNGEDPPDFETLTHIRGKIEYDLLGRAHKGWDNAQRLTVTEYDDLGRVIRVIENADTNDPFRDPTGADTDKHRQTRFEYDHFGRLATRISDNANGSSLSNQKTRYVYGSPLNASWVTGEIYPDAYPTLEPDTQNVWSLPSGGTNHISYTYDRIGREVGRTDRRGVVRAFAFNDPSVHDGGRKINAGAFIHDRVMDLGGSSQVDGYIRRISVAYDEKGGILSISSHSHHDPNEGEVRNQVVFDYDDTQGGFGLVKKFWQENSGAVVAATPKLLLSYDLQTNEEQVTAVRLDRVTYPSGREVYYRYGTSTNSNDRLSRVYELASASSDGAVYARYGYLGADSIARASRPAITNGLVLDFDRSGNGTFAELDRFGRAILHAWQPTTGTGVFAGVEYGFDARGNRQYRVDLSSSTAEFGRVYGHDDLDRMTSVHLGVVQINSHGLGTIQTANPDRYEYMLDSQGNWTHYGETQGGSTILAQSRWHDPGNRISRPAPHNPIINDIGTAWVQPEHDADGNMTRFPFAHDPSAALQGRYDAWNRLVEVTDDGNPATVIVTYRYNGLNHRIQRLVGSDPDNPSTAVDFFYNPQWQVLEERQNGQPHVQYLWCERYVDSPVLRWRDSDSDGTFDETLYYLTDSQMNVTALVDGTSGSGTFGEVVERYIYDPYGRGIILDGDGIPRGWTESLRNEIRFGGYRLDHGTGLYHVRHRMLHPTLGRWMQEDPLGYVDGGNLYAAYMIMWGGVDPRGLRSEVLIENGEVFIHQQYRSWRWPFGRVDEKWSIGTLAPDGATVLLNRGGVRTLDAAKTWAAMSKPNWKAFLEPDVGSWTDWDAADWCECAVGLALGGLSYGSDLANLVVDVARRPWEFAKETIAALDELRGSILELDLMAVTEAVLPDTTVLVKYWGPLAKHPQTKCQIAARSVIELAGTVFAVKGAANSLLKLKNLGRRHWTPAQARAQFGGGPNPGATPPPVPPAAVGAPKSGVRSHADLVDDFHTRPGDWERVGSQAAPGAGRRTRGGVSVETQWRNRRTGETLSTHEAFDAAGNEIHRGTRQSPNLPDGGSVRPGNRAKEQ